MMKQLWVCTFSLAFVGAAVGRTFPVTLIEDGRALCAIRVSPMAPEEERTAAADLARYLQRMSGADVPVIAGENTGPPPMWIYVGKEFAEDERLLQQAAASESGFVILVRPNEIRLAGTSPRATAYAVYHLLEQLGCRWFMPGEIGQVVPGMPTVQLEEQELVELPDFEGRHMQGEEQWSLHNKLGGPHFPPSHSWNRWLPPKEHFEEHPQFYSLINGERQPRQLCTSNPTVIEQVAKSIRQYLREHPDVRWVGIGPDDGRGFCECDNCCALDTGDWDPYGNDICITDRFLTFGNAVAAKVHEEFPEAHFAYYIYSIYQQPPLKVRPDPSIIGALAPISLCRAHGLNNPICPERNFWKGLIDGWTDVMEQVYHRGYSYNLAGVQAPFSLVHVWREEVPYCKQQGIKGFRVETQISWASHMPNPYIMPKLFWDADADVGALLDDYFSKFFGPAARPMHRYWQRMDTALRDAPYHTGSSYDVPHWYPAQVVNAGRRDLRRAAKLALTPMQKERVRISQLAHEYLEAFLALLEHQNACEFAAACDDMERMVELARTLQAYDPPMLSTRLVPRFIDRFWRAALEEGRERTAGGNELVAAMPNRWKFFLDPYDAGEGQSFQSDETSDVGWQELPTYSSSWSNQGLRYYRGHAWYRTHVTVPARFRGRQVFLWFGAVDEAAKVWVNGEAVGGTPDRHNASAPFEVEVTNAIRWGEPNLIAVKVTNVKVNELGTGGIVKPVMLWAKGA